MQIDGGCHCGQFTYQAKVDPDKVVICHCTDCQTLSGTAFRVVVRVPRENFTPLTGTTKTYFKIAESGARRAMAFCPECGTQIYGSSDAEEPETFSLRMGTARQRDRLRPRKQIWCRSALPWIDSLPAVRKILQGAPETDAGSGH